MTNLLKLYTYYRSTAAYRVRIALNYKNVPHELIAVDIIQGKHRMEEYKKHNRQGRIPTLSDCDFEIGQSSAILEYLEEKYPQPALLPSDTKARAWVRYLSQIVISDMHPLNNSGVLNYLKNSLHLNQDQVMDWYQNWLKQGFDTLELILANNKNCGNFCFGDQLTLADICLIPQVYNAYRFNCSMDNYPTLRRINDYCLTLPYFDKARPEKQIDYVTDRPNSSFP